MGARKSKTIEDIRRRIVPLAQGSVLEIGVGPGVNVSYYDPARVSNVYALEPNLKMLRRAEEQQQRTQMEIEFLALPGGRCKRRYSCEHLYVMHDSGRGGGDSRRTPGPETGRQAHLLRAWSVARSYGTALAKAIGTAFSLGIRRLPRDT
jgi:hypothetical protein